MNLRTKLTLSIGLLIFLVAIAMVVLPDILVRVDLDDTVEEVLTVVSQENLSVAAIRTQTVAALENLHDKLLGRFLIQILIGAVILFAISLFVLRRIASGITKPLAKLAHETTHIAEGQYGEVVLPNVGKRKDEVATLTHAFGAMVQGLQEREKIRGVLDKVVSKDVADEILKTSIHLGGEDRICSILFSDIRGFTEMSENLPPQTTIKMLNTYMTHMSRIIEGEGGVIDKYVGDEIMALYGAPTVQEDHALRALSSAMLMIERLKIWNEERVKEGLPPVTSGIGIHSGLVVAGNMGAEDRLNYTVLGANVNLASRLCSVAGPMQIIISESTLKEPGIEEQFYVKPLESIALKGITDAIKIYEVVNFKWEIDQ